MFKKGFELHQNLGRGLGNCKKRFKLSSDFVTTCSKTVLLLQYISGKSQQNHSVQVRNQTENVKIQNYTMFKLEQSLLM